MCVCGIYRQLYILPSRTLHVCGTPLEATIALGGDNMRLLAAATIIHTVVATGSIDSGAVCCLWLFDLHYAIYLVAASRGVESNIVWRTHMMNVTQYYCNYDGVYLSFYIQYVREST